MELLRGPLEGADLEATGRQALEMALAEAMMRRVSRGEAGPMLRVYRPTSAAVASSATPTCASARVMAASSRGSPAAK